MAREAAPRGTFVDTSGFYARLAARDDRHAAAARFMLEAQRRRVTFVTTDYVLDETVTLLVAHGLTHLVQPLLDTTVRSEACRSNGQDQKSSAERRPS